MFGAGPIAEKSFRRLQELEIKNIVDNAQNLWGKHELGFEMKLLKESKKYFVVICTTSFNEVCDQLTAYGLTSGSDFCVSPILNDLQIIDNLQNIQQKILFSSGSPKQDDPAFGGGLYELKLTGDIWQHRKVLAEIAMVLRSLAITFSRLIRKLGFLNSIATMK